MKKMLSEKTLKTVIQRNKYSVEIKEKARKYYLLGLNMQEISKLLDNVPVRTLELWQSVDNWTDIKNIKSIKLKTLQFIEAGKSWQEISDLLNISRSTIWRYIKSGKIEAKKA